MTQIRIFIISIFIAGIIVVITSFIRSPWQTYPDGIVSYAQDKNNPICDFPSMPGASCSDIHSIDYGFPLSVKKNNDAVYYPSIMPGTYYNLIGVLTNFLLYFIIAFFFFYLNLKLIKKVNNPPITELNDKK